jgi:hypothetical protein
MQIKRKLRKEHLEFNFNHYGKEKEKYLVKHPHDKLFK